MASLFFRNQRTRYAEKGKQRNFGAGVRNPRLNLNVFCEEDLFASDLCPGFKESKLREDNRSKAFKSYTKLRVHY